MTKDEFIQLSQKEQVDLVMQANLITLEDTAIDAGGWEADTRSVDVNLMLTTTDPARNLDKNLRSYFGPIPPAGTQRIGILRIAPKGFCKEESVFDGARYQQEALDYYYPLSQEGWRNAWSWARSVTRASGGVELQAQNFLEQVA